MKIKKCPFCGGDFEIVIVDNNEKIRTEEFYEDDPVDGKNFGIVHKVEFDSCPIATLGDDLVGGCFYPFIDGAINAINKRAEK